MRKFLAKPASEGHSQGALLVDATSAAMLLKDSGVLESARRNMVFYKVAPASSVSGRKHGVAAGIRNTTQKAR